MDMANKHHQPSTSPIREHEREGQDIDYYRDVEEPSSSWCSPCFGFKYWTRPRGSSDYQDDHHPSWWNHVKESLMKVREASEVAAGPKWKNFVRKIGGYFRGKKPRRGNFQYDAESYALNFDGGANGEEEGLLSSYSSRFVGPSFPHSNEQNRAGL